MVEACEVETAEPQNISEEMQEFEDKIPSIFTPMTCEAHKMVVMNVSQEPLRAVCAGCFVDL